MTPIPLANLVRVHRDGPRWLALVGEDPQRGMLGAGPSPGAALAALAAKLVAWGFDPAAAAESWHRPGFPPPANVIRLTRAAGRWEARVGPDPRAFRTLPASGDSPAAALWNLIDRLHSTLWQFHPGRHDLPA